MTLAIKICVTAVLISEISCLNCLSDVTENNCNKNLTANSQNFSFYDKVISYDATNRIIFDNVTDDFERFPHHIVPEISTYERGEAS